MANGRDLLADARAEALFTSDLSAQSCPAEGAVAAAIRRAVRTHGGVRACAGEVGAAYGEHPETAAARMRWARRVIEATYSPRAADRRDFGVWIGAPDAVQGA